MYKPVLAYPDKNGNLFSTVEEAEESDLFYQTIKEDTPGPYLSNSTIKTCIKVCRKYFTQVPLEEKKDLNFKYVNLLKEIRNKEVGDTERAHSAADDVLVALLVDLGFDEVVEAYNDMPKWYA